MRLSTSWMYQRSVETMLAQQSALSDTQSQVSSGNRISVASDDPAGAGQVVRLNHTIAATSQYTDSINNADTQLSSESSALDSVTDLLDQVRTIALQGINGSLSDSDRTDMASQLSQIRDELLQLANTTDASGNALFAGTSSVSVPFVKNADGSVSYLGNDSQPTATVGSGLQVATGDAGSSVFMDLPAGNGSYVASAGSANTGTLVVGSNSVTDSSAWSVASGAAGGSITIRFDGDGNWTATDADGNALEDSDGNAIGGTYTDGGSISFDGISISVSGTPADGDTISVQTGQTQDVFTTLDQMISALQSDDSDTQLTNSLNRQIESLDQALDAVTATQTAVGGRISMLEEQSTTYSDLSVNYQSALSNVQDVDAYTAISQLTLQSTALQASMQTFSVVSSLSLFKYLQ